MYGRTSTDAESADPPADERYAVVVAAPTVQQIGTPARWG
jgi:hypothetical protein